MRHTFGSGPPPTPMGWFLTRMIVEVYARKSLKLLGQ